MQKLPYILVVGDKEKEVGAVAVRARGNKDLGLMSIEAFAMQIASDIAQKIWTFLRRFLSLKYGYKPL